MQREIQALQPTNFQLPIGSLEAYIQRVNDIPMLTQAEEQALAIRLQEQGDLKAAQHLVLSHLRYVVRVSRGYLGYGLPLGDLIQEGTVGLMKAVKRFDPTMGVRLVSFAVHWIKAEIHEYVLKNWRIVKVATTKAQRKLFFNLRTAKKRLGWSSPEEIQAIADDLGVCLKEVYRMEERLNARDVAFDLPANEENYDSPKTSLVPAEFLEDEESDPAIQCEAIDSKADAAGKMKAAFSTLDHRSQDILTKRLLLEDKRATLEELAQTHKVSAERIRQLEKAALLKLKEAIAKAA